MQTRSEMETELLSRLQVAANSTLFPASRLTLLIQNAHIWATQIAYWHDLVRARMTNSFSSYEYYDYPANFRSESIIRLEMDGDEYKRKNWEDYLTFKDNNPSSTKKMFASFGRQFFIHPTPTTNGTNNITAWGSIQADSLSAASSTTIFSNNKEEGNEAIVRKAFSDAMRTAKADLAKSEEQEAITILMKLASDEQNNTKRNQRLQHPMLAVPDYFASGSGGATPYGRFNYDPEGGDQ